MPSWNKTAVIRISARGVARTERQLTMAEDEVQMAVEDTLDDLRRPILNVYEDRSVSMRLAGGLVAIPFFQRGVVGFEVTSTYRDPFTGYDPLGVTRFGHRKKIIRPREDRFRSSILSTRRPRGPEFIGAEQRQAQTALQMRGKPEFRHYAKGQTRSEDWVKEARSQIVPLLEAATERLGRKVVSSLR